MGNDGYRFQLNAKISALLFGWAAPAERRQHWRAQGLLSPNPRYDIPRFRI
jgi:hypothetical protein